MQSRTRADAEQAVEKASRLGEQRLVRIAADDDDANPRIARAPFGVATRFAHALAGVERHDDPLAIGFELRQRGEDVAAVVAASGDADHASLRGVRAHEMRDGAARASHELRRAVARAGGRVEGAHRVGGEDAHQASSTTTAAAVVAVCVMVRWIVFTPRCAARFADASSSTSAGLPLASCVTPT